MLIKEGLLVNMQNLDGNPLDQAEGPDDQGQEGEVDLDGPTWVDDHAIFTVAQGPNDIVHNIRTIMVTLEAVAARHGFCLNTKKGKTECVITFAGKGIMAAKRALDRQEDHPPAPIWGRLQAFGHPPRPVSVQNPGVVSSRKNGAYYSGCHLLADFAKHRSSPYLSDDKRLWPVLTVPFSRRQDGGRHRRNASSAFSMQVSDASCSGKCQAWAGRSNRRRTPKAAQGTSRFACPAGSSIAISTTPAFAMLRPLCVPFSDSPCAGQWRQTMAKDLFDKSRVLSSKLEQLPDHFLNTTPWYDMAYRFPVEWRALVKLCMSKCVDMDQSATAVDPSDVGRE